MSAQLYPQCFSLWVNSEVVIVSAKFPSVNNGQSLVRVYKNAQYLVISQILNMQMLGKSSLRERLIKGVDYRNRSVLHILLLIENMALR